MRAQHSVQRIIGELLLAQPADNRACSTAYRVLPASCRQRNPAEFDFSVSPVNQGLVRELHEGGLATQRNAVLIGGTGTGKEPCIDSDRGHQAQRRARSIFTAIGLINARGRSACRKGRAPRWTNCPRRSRHPRRARLSAVPGQRRTDAVPTLISRLYERTSIIPSPPISPLPNGLSVFADAKMTTALLDRWTPPSLRHPRNRQRELALQKPRRPDVGPRTLPPLGAGFHSASPRAPLRRL